MKKIIFYSIIFICYSCSNQKLTQVTTADFRTFVEETNYVTDAEKYDWSIVQLDVINYEIIYGIDWRCPTGMAPANDSDPVTQVSYNDALAYATWIGASLPDYEQYWELSASDARPINAASLSILPVDQVNMIGNVWEITTPGIYGNIRLAGGSYLCDKNTCDGTSKERELLVDMITGNSHIGFAIIE